MWYLATPYSKYKSQHHDSSHGTYYPGPCEECLEEAYQYAAETAALFTDEGLIVFSPIVHSHPQQVHIGRKTHQFWMRVDDHFMKLSTGLIVAMMPGWKESVGVQEEIGLFTKRSKPVFMLPRIDNRAVKDVVRGICLT